MPVPERNASETLDVTALIDRSKLGAFQLRIGGLCALVALLDGVDTTSIAIAARAISDKLDVPLSNFGLIFSAGTLGATLGAMAFGPLADRFGRKRLLVVATVMFGAFTLLTAEADTFARLMACRLLAGIGLGGATPCFLALVSEYVPSRVRGTVVAALWAAFPLGIMVGGFFNSYLVATFGWQSIFHVGGALPMLVAVILALALPESLQFLILRHADTAKATAIVSRLAPGVTGAAARLSVASHQPAAVPVKQLFAEGRATSTLLLWVPFFTSFGVLAVVVFYTPTLLRTAGIPAAVSAGALVNGFHGLGALLGMAVAGHLVERYGPSMTLSAGLLIGAICTVLLGFSVGTVALAAMATALVGLFVGIAGSGSIAVAALIYPTAIRATGIGWGVGMGRAGQVVAPLIAARLLTQTDGQHMLLVMAAMLITSVVAVFLLGRSTGQIRLARAVAVAGHDTASR
ncbi:MAG: transporter, family, 4-hydroxybenzoate transporter [Pseudonocardiales bacterium]|nr:transporter, family, 4-hydroxybenzoate transporter [Pseudonocardiales bacterium]